MKLSLIHSKSEKCLEIANILKKKYYFFSEKESDVIVALGGDGFILHSIHKYIAYNQPIFGINCGNLGFLLNSYQQEIDLIQTIEESTKFNIHPLSTEIELTNGDKLKDTAFNEISILRSTSNAAHLSIYLNNELKLEQLIGDGVLVATPLGSTAYNLACRGNILPLYSNLLALTPINPFKPLNWNGAILKNDAKITIHNIDYRKRKINLFCDYKKYNNIKTCIIEENKNITFSLLFNNTHDLNQKILKEQFPTKN
jgi:NAD+ kinase